MATRTRDSVPGREKRGTSPSHAPQTSGTLRSSPNVSKTSSPAKNRDPTTTTPTKNVPNYLKPTISSGNDASKQQGKKPFSSSTLIRRRSFDKPPSPSHTQKRVSPIPPLRFSSFSGKTPTSQKVGPDKNLKGVRDAGKHHIMFGASKKSSMYVKKQEIERGASVKKEEVTNASAENHNKSNVGEPETEEEEEDKMSTVTDAEEQTAQDEGNYEKKIEVPKEDQELETTIDQSETETSLSVKSEEPEDKLHNDETNSNEGEMKCAANDVNISEVEENELDESTLLDKKEEIEVQEVAEEEKKVSENTKVEEKQQEVKIAEPEEKQEIENAARIEEKQEIEKSPMEEKKETEKVAQKQQVAHGKKDSAVSNDVIEETASKLREQRKNKVRALAGAFETVISLQETK